MSQEERWQKFSRWDKAYRRNKMKNTSPTERVRIFETLYSFALQIVPEKTAPKWTSDEEAKKEQHLRHLIEQRRIMLRLG